MAQQDVPAVVHAAMGHPHAMAAEMLVVVVVAAEMLVAVVTAAATVVLTGVAVMAARDLRYRSI